MLRIFPLRQVQALFLILLWISVSSGCRPSSDGDGKDHIAANSIAIAVAANMQFAMEELTKAFTEETGISCQTSVSSSGKLTAQIQQGAPFDVFVSANMKYPKEIENSGLAVIPPKVYARGKLVLWSMREGIDLSLGLLRDASVRHIALANPKVAPYGMAAEQVLQRHGMLENVRKKLVFGESIAQTNQFITTQSAEVGFTAMSVVLSPDLRGKGQWISLSTAEYTPIEQGVVIIKHKDKAPIAARRFYDFLSSSTAKDILQDFGYEVEKN
ncbi:MAG: molybdate ABC transporter substrate-binding protein [Saprospiraceae bacterium]|nr:molybdate ABC transporter substrate-binding protein [Saprospiraceae bacterium]